MTIAELYEGTELTLQQIAEQLGVGYKKVSVFVKKNYSKEYRYTRKSKCYRNSKLGENNPSYGKKGEDSLKYKGVISDAKGYFLIIKPEWFTGRVGSKHIFYHHYVWCLYHGRTEVPEGFTIHHCDFDTSNNEIDNLICVSKSDHSRLHNYLKGVTTISKESTAKWLEAHGRDWYL